MFHLFAYLQDEWLSCKILARQRVILQDLAGFWKKILQNDVSSCKILPESCKILQDNHSLSTGDPNYGNYTIGGHYFRGGL